MIANSVARFVANLTTFYVNLLLKLWFGYLSILVTLKYLAKIWLKISFDWIPLCFDVDIFVLWKGLDVDTIGFQNCLCLFPQTFWQHWLWIFFHRCEHPTSNWTLWFTLFTWNTLLQEGLVNQSRNLRQTSSCMGDIPQD